MTQPHQTPTPPLHAAVVPGRWRFGRAELDEVRTRLSLDGQAVTIDRSGCELLSCLLRQAGQVVSKDALLRAGWPGRVVSENSLTKAIGRLRQTLEDPDGELLRVVHGYGYKLVATVQRLDVDAPEAPESLAPRSAPEPMSVTSGSSAATTRSHRVWLLSLLGAVLALTAIGTIRIGFGPPEPAAARLDSAVLDHRAPVSIAVLPFVDLSPEQDQAYFSDGLAEQLIDDLARLPQLRVVGRSSSFARRGEALDAKAMGQRLGVVAVLEGSVRKSGQRLRVTVELVNTLDGFKSWSETYDRPITELFAMQDDIARAIIEALQIELLPEQLRGLVRHRTRSPEAYEQFLLASTRFQDDETAGRRALAAYERAVALDPEFVDAWLGMADILGHSGIYADDAEQALAGKRRALEILDRVVALAPERAEVYLLRGDLRYAHWWDWQGGEQDLEIAAALSSHDNLSYLIRLSRLRAALGHLPEAIALTQRAIDQDPLSVACTVQGYHYTALGDYAHAYVVLSERLRAQPLDEHAHYYLGLGEVLQGRPAQALPHFENSAHFLRLTGMAIAHHSMGDAAASERDLQLLISRYGHILPYQAAEVYAWRGEIDKAFEWLEHAFELHDASFMYLKFDPLLRTLHADPRYRALLIRVNLPV